MESQRAAGQTAGYLSLRGYIARDIVATIQMSLRYRSALRLHPLGCEQILTDQDSRIDLFSFESRDKATSEAKMVTVRHCMLPMLTPGIQLWVGDWFDEIQRGERLLFQ